VRVASDGPSAVAVAKDFQPDVALLDIGLPGMDGYQVARALRADAGTRRAQLIAVTGWGQEEDRRRARQNGFDAHLTKPADPDLIRHLVAAPAGRASAI
jgi:CheY-like chemotaxis protein